MKALIQRVKQASVSVDNQIIGQIECGILAYIGLADEDNLDTAKKMIDKILTYRIFENTEDSDKLGKLDKNVQQIQGGLLLVSQFTLMAKTNKGRRPDFTDAMEPNQAKELFTQMVAYAKTQHHLVEEGEFGSNMQVSAINDGPINLILEL